MERTGSTGLTMSGVMFTLVVPGPMAGVIPWFITRWRFQPAFFGLEPLRWVGAAAIAVGIVLLAAAILTFGREGVTAYPPCTKIVDCDLYAYTRNPMYTGVLLIMSGQGWLFASAGMLWYALGWFVFFHVFESTFDEPFLKKKFPDTYPRYHESVPRWIPRRRK